MIRQYRIRVAVLRHQIEGTESRCQVDCRYLDTLVHLAATHSLTTVFTVDHADFETYRIPGGRSFRVVPGRR